MGFLARAICTSAAVVGALGEGSAPGHWLLAAERESCDKACSKRGGHCSEEQWPESAEDLRAIADELSYSCKEIQEGAIRYDPSTTGAFCGWKGEERESGRGDGRCSASPPWSTRRFCFCTGTKTSRGAAGREANETDAPAASTTLPFDCNEGYNNWERGWSRAKKAWCCRRTSRGCPTTTTSTTTSPPFDCDAGYSNYEAGWSQAKMAWCCRHEGRGCTTTTVPTTTSAPYDCEAGKLNWKKGWSDGKKEWCCLHEDVGCPFDCHAGYFNWKRGWSDQKKEWCCQTKGRGCP